MATTTVVKYPSSFNQSTTSGSLVGWNNPANAYTKDDYRATCSPNGDRGTSMTLRLGGFGFAVPAGSTIDSVSVTLAALSYDNRASGGPFLTTYTTLVANQNGTQSQVGVAKSANAAQSFTITNTTHTNFGATLTPEQINDPLFGVGLYVTYLNGSSPYYLGSWQVDAVSISVTYSSPSGTIVTPDTPAKITVTQTTQVPNTNTNTQPGAVSSVQSLLVPKANYAFKVESLTMAAELNAPDVASVTAINVPKLTMTQNNLVPGVTDFAAPPSLSVLVSPVMPKLNAKTYIPKLTTSSAGQVPVAVTSGNIFAPELKVVMSGKTISMSSPSYKAQIPTLVMQEKLQNTSIEKSRVPVATPLDLFQTAISTHEGRGSIPANSTWLPWTNPNGALANDNGYAYTEYAPNKVSEDLVMSFDLSRFNMPPDAVITRLTLNLNCYTESSNGSTLSVNAGLSFSPSGTPWSYKQFTPRSNAEGTSILQGSAWYWAPSGQMTGIDLSKKTIYLHILAYPNVDVTKLLIDSVYIDIAYQYTNASLAIDPADHVANTQTLPFVVDAQVPNPVSSATPPVLEFVTETKIPAVGMSMRADPMVVEQSWLVPNTNTTLNQAMLSIVEKVYAPKTNTSVNSDVLSLVTNRLAPATNTTAITPTLIQVQALAQPKASLDYVVASASAVFTGFGADKNITFQNKASNWQLTSRKVELNRSLDAGSNQVVFTGQSADKNIVFQVDSLAIRITKQPVHHNHVLDVQAKEIKLRFRNAEFSNFVSADETEFSLTPGKVQLDVAFKVDTRHVMLTTGYTTPVFDFHVASKALRQTMTDLVSLGRTFDVVSTQFKQKFDQTDVNYAFKPASSALMFDPKNVDRNRSFDLGSVAMVFNGHDVKRDRVFDVASKPANYHFGDVNAAAEWQIGSGAMNFNPASVDQNWTFDLSAMNLKLTGEETNGASVFNVGSFGFQIDLQIGSVQAEATYLYVTTVEYTVELVGQAARMVQKVTPRQPLKMRDITVVQLPEPEQTVVRLNV